MTDTPLPAAGTRSVRELQSRLAHYEKFPTLDPMGRRRTRLMTGLPFRLIEDGLPLSARVDADLRTRWGTVPPEQQARDYLNDTRAISDVVDTLDALVWMMGDAEHRAFMAAPADPHFLPRLLVAAQLIAPGA